MANRLKLGIDVDEVITDFITPFRREAETILGKEFPRTSTSWGFEDWGLTARDREKIWKHIKATENWFYLYDSEAFPCVSYILPNLAEDHEVFFITSRVETAGFSVQRQTQMTLADLGVEFPTVIVTDYKGPVAAALELDAFVDDKPSNLSDVQECSPRTRIYLMNQSQSASFPAPKSWTRVNNLEDFAKKI